MIFEGINNQTVEFRITNYQFPEITDCEYDSNWLMIYLNVKSNCGNWQTIDPSLLTSDIIKIIQWFDNLSIGRVTETNLSFLEPNLEFELVKNETVLKTLRIKFYLESRPKNADENKDYFVDCEMDNTELKRVSDELKKELKSFPERVT